MSLAAALAGLPFPAQTRMISAAVERGGDLATLLEDLAALPDFEPLAVALRLVGREGGLAEPALVTALGRLLLSLPDHGVLRVLSSLDPDALGQAQTRAIVSCVLQAAERLPIGRIAAICLAARWLRRADPIAAERVLSDAEGRCDSCLDASAADDTLLVLLRGRKLASLARDPAWQSRVESFASKVLDVLGAQPKSLSQANAEELLARRVYAEPGHFLFELLQNAEDAGAATWEVDLRPDEVLVWHDGEPFDARDVVGVLSIGQTTKRADQIGLFGVGFKAVYEVSERPQIASGPFRFEIADVSIPRGLDAALHGERDDGTLLVLPLRDPGDPTRSADALFAHGVRVPPETLLTLRSLRRWRFTRGDRTHTVRKAARTGDGLVSLIHEESGQVQTFVVESGEAAWDPTRARVPVMVAVAVGTDGSPQPVHDGPTVFSHLPTGERSGLRFLIHASFDVPLDRERLDLQSAKNLAALEYAGSLLVRAVRQIVARSQESKDHARVLGELLRVLPLRSELGHPAYARLLDAFTREAVEQPMLCGAGGELLEPRRGVVLPEASLATHLATIELDASGRRALAPLDPRSENVALELGAVRLGYHDLVAWVARVAASVREGTMPDDPRLSRALPSVLDAVGRAGVSVDLLRSVACLPDAQGCFRTPQALARAYGAVRTAYGNARPLLAARLADEPTDGLRRVLDLLGIPTLGAHDLARDLQDDEVATLLLDPDRDELVFAALESLPGNLLSPLAARPRFRDEDGIRRPLHADEASSIAWLAPGDGLDALIGSVRTRTPRLIAPALQARFPSLLERLGGRVFGAAELLEAIGRGEVWLSPEQLSSLHRWLEEGRAWLSARITRAIASAPIFPDRMGQLRPLLGKGRAWLADDADVAALSDAIPWVAEPTASLALVQALPVQRVGPDTVVRTLLGEPGPFGLGDALDLRRAYVYLARHGGRVLPELAERLIDAPVWQDTKGQQRSLRGLRAAPRDEVLLALYQQWDRFPLIDDDGPESAGAAVRGLRLDRHLVEPDAARLVADLCVGPPDTTSQRRPSALVAALRALPSQVSRRALEPLRHAPIFQSTTGQWLPLAAWSEPGDRACRRAVGSLREVLAYGRRPLLSIDDEQQLAALLDALGVPVASLVDLADALMTDRGLKEPAALDAARRLLASEASETALVFPPPEPGVAHAALAVLPIWPTTDGRRLPAREVVRSTDVAQELGELAAIVGETASDVALLDDSASQDADRLRGLVFFRKPGALLVATVRAQAREGEALGGQQPLLRTADRVARVLEAVVRYEGDPRAALQLPLVVDAGGRLVSGARWQALPEEIALAEGLPIHAKLADPQWARRAGAIAPEICPPLPPRRLMAALAEVCRESIPVQDHSLFHAESRRRALYAWLMVRGEEIARDLDALSTAARACIVPDAAGVLRAPRDLLIDAGPAELGLGGGVAEEVPEILRDWLRTAFRLDDERLRALVQRVLDAHGEAVLERDIERSRLLVGYLAHILIQQSRGEESALAAAAQKWNVRKRLRVAATDGEFERPRRMMIPEPATWDLVAAFDADPPRRPHEAYDGVQVRALLIALGAQREIPEARVTQLLAGDRLLPGRDARVALARYIAMRAYGSPPLRNTWYLDRDAWMPDATGALRVPSELFWPDAAVRAVMGDQGDSYPDQAIVRTLPQAVATWLRFKQPVDVSLGDVARRWQGDEPIPQAILEWLEEALRSKRVAAQDVRGMLLGKALLIDQDGVQRDAAHLVLDDAGELAGRGWGEWTMGRRVPRLAAAIGIPEAPGPRQHRQLLEDVAEQIEHARGIERQSRPMDSRPAREAARPDNESQGGWLTRLQAWFRGGDERGRPAHDRPVAPNPGRKPGLVSKPASKAETVPLDVTHASWFQAQDAIRPQLDDLRGWLASRDDRPRFGFAFAPPRLRLPWTYAPKLIADQFESGTQRWASKAVEPDWSKPAAKGKDIVTLRGRIPAGEVVLPVPMYAHVVRVDGARGARLVLTASGQSMLVATEAAELTLQIALDSPPAFDEGKERSGVSRALLACAVPDDDLPLEVVELTAELAASEASLFERALEVREFIRTHYRYDPSYMGDPALAKWLRRVADGRASVPIAALHAGRDARHLGRGVCYELNTLACELLRRAGVPAAVATGWTLDRGSLTEPDHLWALALLPTPVGWRWFPVDASTTHDGRPLHGRSDKARGPWRVPPAAGRQAASLETAWMRRERDSFNRIRKPKRRAPVAELVRVVRHAERVGKLELGAIDLQERCRQVLSDPELAAALVELLRRGR